MWIDESLGLPNQVKSGAVGTSKCGFHLDRRWLFADQCASWFERPYAEGVVTR